MVLVLPTQKKHVNDVDGGVFMKDYRGQLNASNELFTGCLKMFFNCSKNCIVGL